MAICNKHGDAVIRDPTSRRPARPKGLRYAAAESPSSLLKNLEMESFRILAGRCWGDAAELM
jgi:hypothetical protein